MVQSSAGRSSKRAWKLAALESIFALYARGLIEMDVEDSILTGCFEDAMLDVLASMPEVVGCCSKIRCVGGEQQGAQTQPLSSADLLPYSNTFTRDRNGRSRISASVSKSAA